MKQGENRRCRHSIRLSGYDYAKAGAYYVTVCTINRECLFGRIECDKSVLSPFGEIAESEWRRTREIRRNVEVDEFIVMPNHIHDILFIDESAGATRCVAPARIGSAFTHDDGGRPHGPVIGSIGLIIGQYKSIVTKRINQLRNSRNAPVWQRNYYEHVVRDEKDLNDIRDYIRNNAFKWSDDHENPDSAEVTSRVVAPLDKNPGLS